jgi:hypothetical protein
VKINYLQGKEKGVRKNLLLKGMKYIGVALEERNAVKKMQEVKKVIFRKPR